MERKTHCQACTNLRFGVKTRRGVPHKCGRTDAQLNELKRKYDETHRDKRIIKTGN